MPYPTDSPKAKHDLLGTYPVNHNNELITSVFGDWETLSNAMKHFQSSKKLICHVYSYSNGPNPPLSKKMEIVGFISIKTVSSILASCSNHHVCSIGVKKSNFKDDKDKKLSTNFCHLIRQCQDHMICAIILPDRDNRISVLKYFDDTYHACESFILKLDEFEMAFQNIGTVQEDVGVDDAVVASTEELWQPVGQEDKPASNELWQPAGQEQNSSGNELWQSGGQDENTSNLWQPAEEENASNLWQPPGQEDNSGGDNLWQPSSTSGFDSSVNNSTDIFSINNTDSRKRSRSPSPVPAPAADKQFHKDDAAAAADKFYSTLTRELGTRADSRLFHMRAFNGWVKATQIMELDPQTSSRALRIMDLACGKGGDLGKWILHKRGIANYVGIDVARGSLKDAALRIQRLKSGRKTVSIPLASLICADLGEDVPSRRKDKLLTWEMNPASLREKDPQFYERPGGAIAKTDRFDVISIQFAIHYMMKTRERARRFFKTVGDTLDLGGNMIATTIDARVVIDHIMNLGYDFWNLPPEIETVTISVGNGACNLTFQREVIERLFSKEHDESTKFGLEYFFSLNEGSNHAAGVGQAVNLPEWLIPITVLQELAEEAGLEMETGENFHEFYSNRKNPALFPQQHNAVYNMHVLNKEGSISSDNWEISRMYIALKFTKIMECEMMLDGEEEEDEEEEEEPEPPKLDMSKLPMAMMKAKKVAGINVWSTLSSQEKKELALVELTKMA